MPSLLSLADALSRPLRDGVALIHEGERWTWAALDRRSAEWAAHLAEAGVGKDDLVAFVLPNGFEFFALTFGIYRAGATPAPISPRLPPREIADIVALMQPAAIVGDGMVAAGTPLAPPPPGGHQLRGHHIARSWKACTSGGSTGRPKVIVDGRAAGFAPDTDFIGIPADDIVLVPGPLYHNAPFSAAVFAIWRGSTVVTMARFDASGALGLIERERVAWSLMVPTMLHRIWKLPTTDRDRFDLSSWKMVVHTAAPMPAWLKLAWIDWRGADHIWEVYGATEGLVRCWIGGGEWLERPGSVGRPIGGARIRILDDDGHDLPSGVTGDIFALPPGGPTSSYHYIGAERRATADGWETVGDCGHLDADGYLFLADRRSDLIISGGVNIWPAEVEAAILRHPAVRSCAVMGEPDDDLGQCVCAIIEADIDLTLAELRAFLRDYLSPEKAPRKLTCQTTPVQDDAGKFRKTRLQVAH